MRLEHYLACACLAAGVVSIVGSSAPAAAIFIVGAFVLVGIGNIRREIGR